MIKKTTKRLLTFLPFLIILILAVSCSDQNSTKTSKLKFEISFTEDLSAEALDGRMLLMIRLLLVLFIGIIRLFQTMSL